MRAWYMPNMSLGLLYNCTLGDIRPDYPVALVSNHNREGADFMEVIPTENQVPAQREQVRECIGHARRPNTHTHTNTHTHIVLAVRNAALISQETAPPSTCI